MTKLVRNHYPAEKLPMDLREGIDPNAYVRIIVETQDHAPKKPRPMASLIGAAPGVYGTPEEALEAIRALRDEWE